MFINRKIFKAARCRDRFVLYQDILTLFILISICLPLQAGSPPVPGRWQKVTALEPGTEIILHTGDGIVMECSFHSIVDRAGKTVERDDFRLAGDRVWTGYGENPEAGEFASLSRDGFLVCGSLSGMRQKIPLGSINRIIQPKAGEYSREWAVWGTVGGAASGTLFSAVSFDNLTPTGHLLSALAGAGIGALIGSISGSAAGTPGETIYISPEQAKQEAVH